jgi:hypothetical protein
MATAQVELLLIRQLFDEAHDRAALDSPIARFMAALNLDLCIELALHLVLRNAAPSAQPRKRSPRQDFVRRELWHEADEILSRDTGNGLPHASELRTLHETRNLAQHAGTIPSAEAVGRAVAPVREFLAFIYSRVFSLDFNRFCLWDLVSSLPLRNLFEDIDYALEIGHPLLAIAGCQQAHRRIREGAEVAAEGFVTISRLSSWPQDRQERAIRETADDLATAINSMRMGQIAAGAGIRVTEILRYGRSGRGVVADESVGGHIWLSITRDDAHDQLLADAQFMFEYNVRLALALEQTYPDVLAEVKIPIRLRDQKVWKELMEERLS